MYVAELDRPWTDTPFMFQGFMLSTQQQLDALKKYCSTVIIDPERSAAVEAPAPRVAYPERAPVEVEIGPAKTSYSHSRVLIRHVISAARPRTKLHPPPLNPPLTPHTHNATPQP